MSYNKTLDHNIALFNDLWYVLSYIRARGFMTVLFLRLGHNACWETYEPVHEISNNVVCATSKTSDQTAHMRSLIRAFAYRLSSL